MQCYHFSTDSDEKVFFLLMGNYKTSKDKYATDFVREKSPSNMQYFTLLFDNWNCS